jgi:hypothetical protein
VKSPVTLSTVRIPISSRDALGDARDWLVHIGELIDAAILGIDMVQRGELAAGPVTIPAPSTPRPRAKTPAPVRARRRGVARSR